MCVWNLINIWAMATTGILCLVAGFVYLRETKHHSPHSFSDVVQSTSYLIAAAYLAHTLSVLSDPSELGPCLAFIICLALYGTLVKIATHLFLFLSLHEPSKKGSESLIST